MSTSARVSATMSTGSAVTLRTYTRRSTQSSQSPQSIQIGCHAAILHTTIKAQLAQPAQHPDRLSSCNPTHHNQNKARKARKAYRSPVTLRSYTHDDQRKPRKARKARKAYRSAVTL